MKRSILACCHQSQITVKWVICIFGIVFGTFWLGPGLSELAHIAKDQGMKAFSDPEYLGNQQNLIIYGTSQALTVIFAVFISTLKPWRKKRKSKRIYRPEKQETVDSLKKKNYHLAGC